MNFESKKKMKKDGLSIMLVFGRWGGIHVTFDEIQFRICFGFVALTILFFDAEVFINNVIEAFVVTFDQLDEEQIEAIRKIRGEKHEQDLYPEE